MTSLWKPFSDVEREALNLTLLSPILHWTERFAFFLLNGEFWDPENFFIFFLHDYQVCGMCFYKTPFKSESIKEEMQEEAIVNNSLFKIVFGKTWKSLSYSSAKCIFKQIWPKRKQRNSVLPPVPSLLFPVSSGFGLRRCWLPLKY